MISKNKIKFINKLKTKKGRKDTGLFLVEGEKMVSELIMSDLKVEFITGLPNWISEHSSNFKDTEIFETDEPTLKKISSLTSPNKVLAVAKIKEYYLDYNEIKSELSLVLDTIQDPGNLGTIIRTANWFGIKNIICSPNSADAHNPKVIQSTMGAIFRVNVFYSELEELFKNVDSSFPIFGTFLDGENIYSQNLCERGFIVFGNESQGISNQLEKYINHKITIPSFPKDQRTMESLNITTAAAIVCGEFRRRMI